MAHRAACALMLLMSAPAAADPGESWLGVGFGWLGGSPAVPAQAADPATHRLGSDHLRHQDAVHVVAFAPNGHEVASGGADRVVRRWRIPDGKPVGTITLPPAEYYSPIGAMAFSPDGTRIAVADHHRLRVFEGPGGRMIHASKPFEGSHPAPALAWVGDELVVYESGAALVGVEVPLGLERFRVEPFGSDAEILDLDAGGGRLAASDRAGRVALLEAVTGATQVTFLAGKGPVYAVRFAPDGKTVVSTGEDGRIAIFEATSGRPLASHDLGQGTQSHLRISPDGRTLARTSGVQGVVLHSLAEGTELRVLGAAGDRIHGLAFSPDGALLATAGGDGRVELWDLARGEPLVKDPAPGHTAGLGDVLFLPDGKTLVTASDDRTLGVWDLTGADPPRFLVGHTNRVVHLGFCSDPARLVSVGVDGEVRSWAWPGLAPAERFSHGAMVLGEVTFAPDGRALAIGGNGTVTLLDLPVGGNEREIPAHTSHVGPMVWSREGAWLVTAASDKQVRTFDLADRRELGRFDAGAPGIFVMAGSPTASIVALGRWQDTSVLLLTVPALEVLATLKVPQIPHAVAFSPSGKRLAVATQEPRVRVFEFRDGKRWEERAALGEHRGIVRALAFSPDGTKLAGASADTRAPLWTLPAE